MKKRDPQNPPESGRLIRCEGEDTTWKFSVIGKFEAPEDGGRAVFFHQRRDGTFFQDRFKWNHATRWEYVDGKGTG